VNYNIFFDPAELAEYFTVLFKERTKLLLQQKEHICIALSGGSTPNMYLGKLAEEENSNEIAWERIHFFWADERMVPPTDPQSNYHAITKVLFSKVDIPEENIHRIMGESVPQLEVMRYGTEVLNNVSRKESSLPEFDWILLGMGSDGHTASIFPNVELKDQFNNITAVSKNPDTGQMRITLTEQMINNAENVTFVITGKEKADVLFEVLKGEKEKYPAGRVFPLSGKLEFLLDKESAALLLK
jgi:6-phosphogluconolactonase